MTYRLSEDSMRFNFPAGESHIKLNSGIPSFLVWVDGNKKPNDLLMEILLLDELYSRRTTRPHCLLLPYLPYSRQDRPTSDFEPFSLMVVGNLLNQTGFERIITLDVHSDVAYGCINNLWNIPLEEIFVKPLERMKDKTLVIPDQGAYKRLSKIEDKFTNTVFAIKQRDTSNGFLTIKEVIGDIKGKDCIIVDDIADGGGTFILLAKELFDRGANSVELMVTHGIFSKGVEVLFDAGINHIYTTNSFDQTPDVRVSVVDVLDIV